MNLRKLESRKPEAGSRKPEAKTSLISTVEERRFKGRFKWSPKLGALAPVEA